MRRLVGWFWVAALTLAVVPAVSEGFGRRGGCRECGPSCCPPPVCETSVPVMPYAPPEVKYEERKVTYMKPVWKDRTIEEVIVRCVPRTEKVFYDVRVPSFSDEKRMVKVARPTTREETVVCKVAYPVHTTEKRTVVQCVPVWRDVEYTCTVNVAKFRPVVRTVPTCTYETKHVVVKVPVCRVVSEVCTDSCGRCYTVCRTVMDYCDVTRCIVCPVYGTREVTVNECYYEPVLHKGVRKVCDFERRETVIDVPVCTTAWKDVPVTRTVCGTEWVDTEVTCRVCTWATEKRECSRTVFDRVADKVSRTIKVCEYETVTDTVRVPVCDTSVACHPVSYSFCDTGCHSGRRGLFRR